MVIKAWSSMAIFPHLSLHGVEPMPQGSHRILQKGLGPCNRHGAVRVLYKFLLKTFLCTRLCIEIREKLTQSEIWPEGLYFSWRTKYLWIRTEFSYIENSGIWWMSLKQWSNCSAKQNQWWDGQFLFWSNVFFFRYSTQTQLLKLVWHFYLQYSMNAFFSASLPVWWNTTLLYELRSGSQWLFKVNSRTQNETTFFFNRTSWTNIYEHLLT